MAKSCERQYVPLAEKTTFDVRWFDKEWDEIECVTLLDVNCRTASAALGEWLCAHADAGEHLHLIDPALLRATSVTVEVHHG